MRTIEQNLEIIKALHDSSTSWPGFTVKFVTIAGGKSCLVYGPDGQVTEGGTFADALDGFATRCLRNARLNLAEARKSLHRSIDRFDSRAEYLASFPVEE